ncbi:copper chaperone PCu(A)C [Duganella sp. FT50W]|uniref:Copper chaperone PCu(A)C n=1 Tax=Duganella lactea TaxID=2692173 RepID=A0A6L8MSK9_9BURK|nr:copper chaperone PCu(A)C [Duganella lactea]MYM85004.1 copper chaperone PCu(A)C [Duganella lactea]
MSSIKHFVIVAACLLAATAQAQVTVKQAWVRATVVQQNATGAFMQVHSPSPVRLVAASSPLTPTVEVHEMAMQNDVMTMRQIPAIEIGAGKTVELKPGGYHIMLLKLTQQVKVGDIVPLTLEFEAADGKRQTVKVDAPARPLNASPVGEAHSGHGGKAH